jgi:hypothetical protein
MLAKEPDLDLILETDFPDEESEEIKHKFIDGKRVRSGAFNLRSSSIVKRDYLDEEKYTKKLYYQKLVRKALRE